MLLGTNVHIWLKSFGFWLQRARCGRMLLAPQQGDLGTSQGGVELALDSPGDHPSHLPS